MATQSSNFSPSASFQLLKSRRIPNRISSFRFDPVCLSNSNSSFSSKKKLFDLICTNCEPSSVRSPFLRSSFSTSMFKPSLIAGRSSENDLVVRATSVVPESAGETPKSSSATNLLQLGLWFALWYFFNIYFNIYNKQVLKVYNFPVTITVVQLVVGTSVALFMWAFNLHKKPKVTAAQLAAILPLAILHTLGNLFTNMSLGKVAVSFTHTIKALEPFFSVVLSAIFLGELPSPWVVLSLTPIVGGVVLASMTEVSFNWGGFWSAMASNLANQSRNVLSKKVMDSLDNINLFSIITIMSLILIAPAAVVMEGITFTPAYMEAAGLNVKQVYTWTLLASLCFHAYQQLSYMILEKVSPVTHSVGNCVKRVVVIVSSVVFFQTPVAFINSLGTGIALAGVFLYSRLKRIKVKSKTA